jgi:hypothetical protein
MIKSAKVKVELVPPDMLFRGLFIASNLNFFVETLIDILNIKSGLVSGPETPPPFSVTSINIELSPSNKNNHDQKRTRQHFSPV